MDHLAHLLKADIARMDGHLLGVGVGVPGSVDSQASGVVSAPTLGWSDAQVGPMLRARLGLPVLVENDVNTLAVADRLYGAGRSYSTYLVVTIGRGIGCGVVVDGSVYRGAFGGGGGDRSSAGGLHRGGGMRVRVAGLFGGVRRRDALIRIAVAAGVLEPGQRIGDLLSAAKAGGSAAIDIYLEAARTFGAALSGVVHTLDPEVVILSGRGIDAWPFWESGFEETFRRHLMPRWRSTRSWYRRGRRASGSSAPPAWCWPPRSTPSASAATRADWSGAGCMTTDRGCRHDLAGNPEQPRAGQRTPAGGAAAPWQRWLAHAGWALFFLLPSAIPLIIFTFLPMAASFWVSLHKWNLISPMKWVGFANYTKLLKDPQTTKIFLHTLAYIVGYLPLVYVGGLGLAMALNKKMAGRSFFRAAIFLPVVTSWVVVALVWQWLLNPANGLVNHVLGFLHLPTPGWWTDPDWAMPSVILASAWKDLGFVMVILLAGLQAIPTDLYEAATVDGASGWQRFRRITLPLLSPSTFFVVVISLINGFQVFDQVFVMTGGGPEGASQVVVGQIYNLTFRYGRAGDASALSWLLFLVILMITAVQLRGQRRWVTHA